MSSPDIEQISSEHHSAKLFYLHKWEQFKYYDIYWGDQFWRERVTILIFGRFWALCDMMLMMIITSSSAVSNDGDDDDNKVSVKCEKIPSELASCPHLIN